MGFLGNMLCVFVKGVLGVCDVSLLRRLNSALTAP
jgi:hypothetical protein